MLKAEGRKDVDTDVLYTAVIFHDIGYPEGKEFHAEWGAKVFYRLRMVWYSLDKGISGAQSYEDGYKHIVMGNNKRLVNPMVTEKAKYYWNEKQKLVEIFTKQLEDDITVNM